MKSVSMYQHNQENVGLGSRGRGVATALSPMLMTSSERSDGSENTANDEGNKEYTPHGLIYDPTFSRKSSSIFFVSW
jgi:hypothetical protein